LASGRDPAWFLNMAPMIPALEKAANSDIGHNGRLFVREAATEAIAAIEKANNP
jgi:hypothetical protein